MLHAWWGLVPIVTDVCDRLSDAGFTAGAEPPEKVVCYYGTGEVPAGARTSSAIEGHFAEADDFEPSEWVTEVETALREAGAAVEFHRYPGTRHWFAEPDRPEYEPAAAEQAWTRTMEFLHLSG